LFRGRAVCTISAFVFPTRNEAQGLVLLEALASGTPVVAYGRCCISGDMGQTGGLVVPVGASFEKGGFAAAAGVGERSGGLERFSRVVGSKSFNGRARSIYTTCLQY
jgi:glycosyltransferase involved in cell wall biosynthesis